VAKEKKDKTVKKGPRQESLPEMGDRNIEALQDAALSYAEVRDQRMNLGRQEVELKSKLLDLMHAHNKESYVFGNVSITIVHEEENVKVKVRSDEPEQDEEEVDDGIPDAPDQTEVVQ